MNTELRDKTVEYLYYLKQTGQNHITLSAASWEALQHMAVPGGGKPPTPAFQEEPVTVPPAASEFLKVPLAASAPKEIRTAPVLPPHSGSLSRQEKITALHELSLMIDKCQASQQLFKRKKNMVFGVGDPDADIMFVGEAPGVEEDEAGEPFVGKAGQLLTKMIEAMGLNREKVYIANIVKFRPDMPPGSSGNRKPTLEEIEVSQPYIRSQIEIIKPKVLVSLGATALEGLLKMEKSSITRMRGTWMEFEGIPLMPTFHPAYLLRNPTNEEKRKVWEDLLLVMTKAGLPVSEKQRAFFLKK